MKILNKMPGVVLALVLSSERSFGMCCADFFSNPTNVECTNMTMPSIPYSSAGGSALKKYHEFISDPKNGFKYFMPTSQEELFALYELFKLGKIDNGEYSSPDERLWVEIFEHIKDEFLNRCKDKVIPVIDEYVDLFSSFLSEITKFRFDLDHEKFVELVYSSNRDHSLIQVLYSLISLSYYQNDVELTTYLANRIDSILKLHNLFYDNRLGTLLHNFQLPLSETQKKMMKVIAVDFI